MKGFPYPTAPSGWFQVGWAEDMAPGGVRRMRYFGQDLVLFRGADGGYRTVEAFCGHLGADLGAGGTVRGDDIVCPFHGWAWDGEGRNVDIPYSARPVKTCLRSYPTLTANGVVLVWHHPDGGAPTWEPPTLPEFEHPDYLPAQPHAVKLWAGVPFMPQVVAENTVDPMHFHYVHRAPRSTAIEKFATEGEYAYILHEYPYGREGAELTPGGTIAGRLEIEVWGVGLICFRMMDYVEAAQFVCSTPIDAETSDVFFSMWQKRRPDAVPGSPPDHREERVFEEQIRQTEMDFPIWSNMRYTLRAPIVREESPTYQNFRKWSRQFYVAAEVEAAQEAAL